MRLQRYIKRVVCVSLSAMLLLTGCGKESPNKKVNNSVTEVDKEISENNLKTEETEVLLASLRDKYGAVDKEYAEEVIRVNRGEALQIPITYDPYAEEDFDWKDHYRLYQDSQMQYEFTQYCYFDYNPDTKMLTINPPTIGAMEMKAYYGSEVSLDDLSGAYLYNDETAENWGNLSQLYLVEDKDRSTGENLVTPVVNILKVNTEIKGTPQVTYSCDEEGNAYIRWDAVEGAKEYLLFSVVKTQEEGYDCYTKTFGRTSDTSWTASGLTGSDEERVYIMNDFFRNFITSDDDLYGGSEDMNEDLFDTMPEYVGVIAINDEGASAVSNLIAMKDYAKMLPNCLAYNNNETEIGDLYRYNVADLPAEVSLTMCDGTTTKRIIDYDYNNIDVQDDSTTTIYINGYAEGTKLYQEYMVSMDSGADWEPELEELKQRQEGLKSKGGTTSTQMNIIDDTKTEEPTTEDPTTEEPTTEEPTTEEPTTEEPTTEKPTTEEPTTEEPTTEEPTTTSTPLTANSALSEYIAMQMLTSTQMIDLSMFTESANVDVVLDAFLEANYQNPLILGVEDVGYNQEKRILYVKYEDSAQSAATKREEIRSKAKDIVAQIINDSMSDLEKEIAINTYLCENAVYDDAALANAEENDFKTVDESFEDSFTPYGVLVKGVGVCASYAGAFKVLADEAGLPSIVVTGYLNGNLPHAWNRVYLDGQWVTIDVTNNDNDQIANALFNVSDSGINGVLVADDRYVMNNNIQDYICNSDDKEYYRYNQKYYDINVIADKLIEQLQANNEVTLRTQYTITDADFQNIAQTVANKSGADMRGFYWLGVIKLYR